MCAFGELMRMKQVSILHSHKTVWSCIHPTQY